MDLINVIGDTAELIEFVKSLGREYNVPIPVRLRLKIRSDRFCEAVFSIEVDNQGRPYLEIRE